MLCERITTVYCEITLNTTLDTTRSQNGTTKEQNTRKTDLEEEMQTKDLREVGLTKYKSVGLNPLKDRSVELVTLVIQV